MLLWAIGKCIGAAFSSVGWLLLPLPVFFSVHPLLTFLNYSFIILMFE
jgi:hypothetical protein